MWHRQFKTVIGGFKALVPPFRRFSVAFKYADTFKMVLEGSGNLKQLWEVSRHVEDSGIF